MGSLETVVYPQENPERPTHSQDWFDTNPNPGSTQGEWATHLCTSLEVIKGLEAQVRKMLQKEKLHLTKRRPTDIAPEIDRKIGTPLSQERTDIFRPNIPREHFILIVRRMANRINTMDRRRQQKASQVPPKPLPPRVRPPKRRHVVVESDSEGNSDFESIFVESTPAPPTKEHEKEPQPVITPPTSVHSCDSLQMSRLTQGGFKSELKAQQVWIQIDHPDDETHTFYCQLSDLSDEEVDMDTCLNIQLDKLWNSIQKWEEYVGCTFIDRRNQYLLGTINGKRRNVTAPANFVLACQAQLAALRQDSKTLAIIEFECVPRPESMKCPSPPTRAETRPEPPRPTGSPRNATIPPPWLPSPAPTANMMSPAEAGTYPSYPLSPGSIRVDPNFRPVARMHEMRPSTQSSQSSTTTTNFKNGPHEDDAPQNCQDSHQHRSTHAKTASQSSHRCGRENSNEERREIVTCESDGDDGIIIRTTQRSR